MQWGPQSKPMHRHLNVLHLNGLIVPLAASYWCNIFFCANQQMVLDGYLMTSMGLKDLVSVRAERMWGKNTLLQRCSVKLKTGISFCFKNLHVWFQLTTSGGKGSFITVVLYQKWDVWHLFLLHQGLKFVWLQSSRMKVTLSPAGYLEPEWLLNYYFFSLFYYAYSLLAHEEGEVQILCSALLWQKKFLKLTVHTNAKGVVEWIKHKLSRLYTVQSG